MIYPEFREAIDRLIYFYSTPPTEEGEDRSHCPLCDVARRIKNRTTVGEVSICEFCPHCTEDKLPDCYHQPELDDLNEMLLFSSLRKHMGDTKSRLMALDRVKRWREKC